jgi:PAS domain S-box-containing protein
MADPDSRAEPIRTVIDTDPGIDDAVAILFALRSGLFDIRGITTVAGNLGIETTTRNAGRILALAGRKDIPVVPGAERALSRNGFDSRDVHGDDGLGGVTFPEPLAPPLSVPAHEWLAKTLLAEPAGALDVLALGPLTNIALLATTAPEAARRIRRLVAMGGAVDEPGNVGPRAEFNLAAERTFGYDKEEAVGQVLGKIVVPPSLRELHREGLARYVGNGEGLMLGKRVELIGMRADGSEFPIEITIQALRHEHRHSFHAFIADISARQDADRARRRYAHPR